MKKNLKKPFDPATPAYKYYQVGAVDQAVTNDAEKKYGDADLFTITRKMKGLQI